MSDEQREGYAAHLRRARTVAVVDEAHQALALEGQEMPRPFAAYAPDTITIGSASKSFWGGLRLGWIRAPHGQMERLTQARVSLDLGAPVSSSWCSPGCSPTPTTILAANRARLREQRDALVAAVARAAAGVDLPRPAGGLALWCQLPGAFGTALATEAERRGVIIAPGPVFAAEGGLDRFVRIPWTRPVDELTEPSAGSPRRGRPSPSSSPPAAAPQAG